MSMMRTMKLRLMFYIARAEIKAQAEKSATQPNIVLSQPSPSTYHPLPASATPAHAST